MMKIGITGQSGFIGTHLLNTLKLHPEKFKIVEFVDSYFEDFEKLKGFVKNCDVIVHLAGLNRHNDPNEIYNTNTKLVNKIIIASETTNSKPHILFSSSIQEEKNNIYGKSKKEGRLLFERWAKNNNSKFTAFIIPNVFGPFGIPFYNSVVATFCHQLANNENPVIKTDSELKLIYVGELVEEIINHITRNKNKTIIDTVEVKHTASIKVSGLLNKLNEYKNSYIGSGLIPDLNNTFYKNLFNTFLSFIDFDSFFPFTLKQNIDDRGCFTEILKNNGISQFSFSTTKSGVTRGNHFHTRKMERFAVIKGEAIIEFRRVGTDKVYSFKLNGNNPSFVDMPVWHTHSITNKGDEDLYTLFWTNEFFDSADPDTFYEEVKQIM